MRKRLANGTVKEYRYPRRPVVRTPRFAPESLDALLAAYRRSPELAKKAPATRQNYAIYLRVLDRVGHLPVRSVTRRMLLDIRDAIAKARGDGAADGFVRAASALLTWALDRGGWIDHHPLARVRALSAGHLPAWTAGQASAALECLPEPLRRVVVLGMHTGQRRGDLIAMTWGAYDGVTIRLRQGKTGTALVLPVHPALRAELEEWKASRTSTMILANARGKPWTAEHLSREMGRALKAIGMAGLNVHGLRKLAATRLAEAGCSAHEIAAVTGHLSLSMVQLYTRSADQKRLATAAVERLETGRVKPRGNRR